MIRYSRLSLPNGIRLQCFTAAFFSLLALSVFPFAGLKCFAADEPLPPIVLGATTALTGKLAFLGKNDAKALEIAAADINARGGINGRKLRLIIEDNQGDPKIAVTSVKKMLEIDKADLIYSAFTHVTQAIKEVVKASRKLMLYHASAGDIAQASPLFFRDYGDAEESGAALGSLLKKRGIEKLGHLSEIGDYCNLTEKGFASALPGGRTSIIRKELFNPGETDMRPMLLRLKQEKPDALLLCTWRDTQLVMKQLKEMGMIHIPTYQFHSPFLPTSDTADVRALLEENGAISTWYGIVKGEATDEQKVFIERFTKESGEPPVLPDAAYVYDDMMILEAALKGCVEAHNVSSDCAARQLLATDYAGLAGPVRFSKERLSNRPVLIITVKNGSWTLLH